MVSSDTLQYRTRERVFPSSPTCNRKDQFCVPLKHMMKLVENRLFHPVCVSLLDSLPEEFWQVCSALLLLGFVTRQSVGLRWNWASLTLAVWSLPPCLSWAILSFLSHKNTVACMQTLRVYIHTHVHVQEPPLWTPHSVLILIVINPWRINPRVCGCVIFAGWEGGWG